MGVIRYIEVTDPLKVAPKADTYTYTAITAANPTGAPLFTKKYQMIQVQIKGTWNTGTLTIQGSDDGTNYLTLYDLRTLTAISYAADPTTLIIVLENPNWIKPVLSGAGTDSINVTITGRVS